LPWKLGIVYKYKENVCDFMVSQAYVKGREATPFSNLGANFFWKRSRVVVIKVIHCQATPLLAPIST